MKKNAREEAWKNTAKSVSSMRMENNDSDISNLNDDESFAPVTEEEKVPLTEEEKLAVRKKLFVLLIVIIIVLLGLFIILIFDPFGSKKDKKNDTNQTEEKEEDKKDEEEQDNSPNTLSQLEDGIIDDKNAELQTLLRQILYNDYEYYENNVISLYNGDNISINSTSDSNKLLLVTKTNDFNELIREQIKDEVVCNNTITVPVAKISEILKEKYNTTISQYSDFIYAYYDNNSFVTYIKFTLNNDNYIGSCYESTYKIDNLIEQKYVSSTKDKDKIYVDVKVAFININGVYRDPAFKELITNDKEALNDEYMPKANTYRYIFNIVDGKYQLSDIQLLK